MIDVKQVKKEIKKLNIPKEYFKIDLDSFFNHDYTILLSIRQDAGKTTQSLLLGLVLYHLYNITTEYIRNDDAQIRQKEVENLYGVIEEYKYIQKLFPEYNSVEYKPRSKKYFLCHRDEDGNIDNIDANAICALHSNENWKNIKSSYNNPNGDYIVLDEFIDTNRATYGIWAEFMNNISTIGRPGAPGRDPHVLMLGNNTDQYNFWFDDFCISKEIGNLKFGGKIELKTDLGTTLTCQLLEASEIQKERLKSNNIRFFGFNTRKSAQFIGSVEWSGESYKHLDFDLNYKNLITRRIYIKHRNRYIQIELFKDEERGPFLFFHFSNPPMLDDNIILTLEPEKKNEVYGIGEYDKNLKLFKKLKIIFQLRECNRAYYSNNYVGEVVADYIKNIK